MVAMAVMLMLLADCWVAAMAEVAVAEAGAGARAATAIWAR